jgi:hypothetical protein
VPCGMHASVTYYVLTITLLSPKKGYPSVFFIDPSVFFVVWISMGYFDRLDLGSISRRAPP